MHVMQQTDRTKNTLSVAAAAKTTSAFPGTSYSGIMDPKCCNNSSGVGLLKYSVIFKHKNCVNLVYVVTFERPQIS